MKIGVDASSLLDKEPSGVGEYTLNILENIFRQDKKNEYILFFNIFKPGRDKLIKEKLSQFSNVKIKSSHLPNRLFSLMVRFLNFPKLDKMSGQADIFFSPNWNFLALSKKCKRVVTVHDISFKLYPEFFSFKKRWWHKLIGPKRFVNRADKIICDSSNTKRDLEALFGVDPEKISVVPLSVSDLFREFKEKVISNRVEKERLEAVKAKHRLPERFILSLSTLEPRKNIISLIQAFNILKKNSAFADLSLVIAGGKGWKYKAIYQEAKKSLFKDNILFLGYVDKEDRPYLYYLSQALVWPTFYEGFGLPPLEAMASGVPVVSSWASSLPEVVGEAALMINPYNVGELERAIELILTDNDLRRKMIEKGFLQMESFSWQRSAFRYLEIFEKM